MPTGPSNEPHLWALDALELLVSHLTAKCPAMKLIAGRNRAGDRSILGKKNFFLKIHIYGSTTDADGPFQ